MSTEREVCEAVRAYLVTEDRIKEKRKDLNEEPKAARETMERTLEELGQGDLFKGGKREAEADA